MEIIELNYKKPRRFKNFCGEIELKIETTEIRATGRKLNKEWYIQPFEKKATKVEGNDCF